MPGAKTKLAPFERKRRSRLLVVDADTQVRGIISEVLPGEKYEVVFGESSDCLETLLPEDSPFDAVLIDLFKSAENYFAWLSPLKEKQPATEVIFVSKLDDMNLWTEAIQCGAYDYLPRPLDREELKRAIINALEKNKTSLI